VEQLHQKAEESMGEPISMAAATFPNLIALHEEDVTDAFEWAGLIYQNFLVYQPSRAVSGQYAANGFGLCSDYEDKESCLEEEEQLPIERTVNIEFTNEALIVEVPVIKAARSPIMWPSESFIDFELGYSRKDNYSNYWVFVKEWIEKSF
jgi:hypothetical protein